MLRWRLLLGPVLIAALGGLCWLDFRATWPGTYLLPLAMGVSLLAAGELLAMFRRRESAAQPLTWVIYGGTLLTVLAAAAPAFLPAEWCGGADIGRLGWLAIGLAAGLLLAIVGELLRYDAPGSATTNLALSALAILYAGGLMGFIAQLRLLGGSRTGMLALVSLIATVKMSDIGQYTSGRLFGRRKLAPTISPGKTWEGAAGGIAFAVVTAWLVFHWGELCMLCKANDRSGTESFVGSNFGIVLFAVAVAAAGMLGDLAESLLKRDAGLKDSSTWLPGFGGALDLLDSLLVAAPVAYLFWALGIVGS